MAQVLKKKQEYIGTTSSDGRNWTWKHVVEEYWNDDYITKNESVIKVTSFIGVSSSFSQRLSFGGYATVNITANGTPRDSSINRNYQSFWIYPGEWDQIQTETFTIKHDANGEKKINTSSSLNTSQFSPNHASASGEFTLTTIPRTTKLPDTINAVTIGGSTSVTIQPASTTFTHSAKITIGTWEKYINFETGGYSDTEIKNNLTKFDITGVGDWYALFTGIETNGIITLYTYNGDTKIGEDSKSITVTCSDGTSSPFAWTTQVTVTDEKSKNVTKNNSRVILNYSEADITFDVYVSSNLDTKTVLSKLEVNGEEKPVSTRKISVSKPNYPFVPYSLTNSRGLTSPENSVLGFSNYVKYIPVGRDTTEPNWTENNSTLSFFQRGFGEAGSDTFPTKVYLSFGSTFYNGYFDEANTVKNQLTVKYRFRKTGVNNEWSSYYIITLPDESYDSGLGVLVNNLWLKDSAGNLLEFDYQEEYEFELTLSDLLTTYTETFKLPSADPIFSWNNTGFVCNKGLTLGGVDTMTGTYYSSAIPYMADVERVSKYDPAGDEYEDNVFHAIKKISTSEQYLPGNPDPLGMWKFDISTITAKQNGAWINTTCLADLVYPVGSLYWSSKPTNPEALFGGKWKQIKDVFILAAGDNHAVDSTGGEETHKLTTNEMPSHNHQVTGSTTTYGQGSQSAWRCLSWADTNHDYWDKVWSFNSGGDQPHNNMPPYVTKYCWERIS